MFTDSPQSSPQADGNDELPLGNRLRAQADERSCDYAPIPKQDHARAMRRLMTGLENMGKRAMDIGIEAEEWRVRCAATWEWLEAEAERPVG